MYQRSNGGGGLQYSTSLPHYFTSSPELNQQQANNIITSVAGNQMWSTGKPTIFYISTYNLLRLYLNTIYLPTLYTNLLVFEIFRYLNHFFLLFPCCSRVRRRNRRIFSIVDNQTAAVQPQWRWSASFRSAFQYTYVVSVRVHSTCRFVPVSHVIIPLDCHTRRDTVPSDRRSRQQRWPRGQLVAPVGHGRRGLREYRWHYKLRSNDDQQSDGKESAKCVLGRRFAVSS